MEVSFHNGEGFTNAMTGLYEMITRTDKDWLRFVRALRRAYSGPPPLCIDGREYHRRQRRRTKRKRKG